jgi:hypothetical protein
MRESVGMAQGPILAKALGRDALSLRYGPLTAVKESTVRSACRTRRAGCRGATPPYFSVPIALSAYVPVRCFSKPFTSLPCIHF